MVFGCIGLGYNSKLVFCENNIDESESRKIFQDSGMCDMLNEKWETGKYIFMQDGAPAHRCATTQLFIKNDVLLSKNGHLTYTQKRKNHFKRNAHSKS